MAADGSVIIDVKLDDDQATKDIKQVKNELNSINGKGFDGVSASASKANLGIKDIVASLGLMQVASKAVDILKNALSGAISRYDTLQNYPKVMQSLGFSAEEASRSTEKLSAGIKGLPTTLDSISSNTQRLAAAMGDLDSATDLSIALNDMFLASGKGAEEANRAFEQFSQMLSTGKVDMQSWKVMMEVAPGQLKQLSESMLGAGNDGMALYEALQSGQITMDEFADAIIEADNGVLNFHEAAKNATGGIATSFTNLKSAVTRGLADTIGALNNTLKEANLPTIQEALGNIQKIVDNLFKGFNEGLKQAQPLFVAFKEVFDQISSALSETLGPAIESISAKLQESGALERISALIRDHLAPWLGTVAEILGGVLSVAIDGIVGIITNIVIPALETLYPIIDAIVDILGTVLPPIIDAVGVAIDIVVAIIGGVIDIVKTLVDGIESAAKGIGKAVDWMKDKFSAFKDGVKTTTDNAKTVFGAFAKGFKGDTEGMMTDLMTVWNKLPPGVQDTLTKAYNFVNEKFTAIKTFITQTVPQIINNVVQWFSELPGKIKQWLDNTIQKIKDWGSNMISSAKQSASDMVTGVIDSIASLPSKLYNWAVDAVQGFVNGIRNMIGSVRDAASSVASAVAEFLHFSEPDVGPLSHASTFMPDMMKLYAEGIKKGLPLLREQIMKAADILNIPEFISSAEISATNGSFGAGISSGGISIVFNGGIQWSGENDIEATMDLIQNVISRRGYRLA